MAEDMEEHALTPQMEAKLHPIYSALDSRQYARALKLLSNLQASIATQNHKQSSAMHGILMALRAHALERQGKHGDALVLVQRILPPHCFSQPEVLHFLATTSSPPTQSSDPLATSNSTSSNSTSNSASSHSTNKPKGKKSKGKKQANTNATSTPSSAAASTVSTVRTVDVDLIDRLDGSVDQTNNDGTTTLVSLQGTPKNTITNETVLATIGVTLKALQLHHTLYQMYHVASEQLMTKHNSSGNQNVEHVASVLKECFLNGLRWAALLNTSGNNGTTMTHLYEALQSTALQLARLTGDSLHFVWCAQTALWHYDSLGIELSHADNNKTTNETTNAVTTTTTSLKRSMLPRLAESLSSRVVLSAGASETTNGSSESSFVPLAQNCLVYFKSLEVQSKWDELLHALDDLTDKANSSISTGSSGGQETSKEVHGEEDLKIVLTRRQRLEYKTHVLFRNLEQYHPACAFFRELILESHDQWSYWLGYLECLLLSSSNESDENGVEQALSTCTELALEIQAQYGKEGSGESTSSTIQTKHPPRAVHLILVEVAAVRARGGVPTPAPSPISFRYDPPLTKTDASQTKNGDSFHTMTGTERTLLREALIQYGTLFAPLAACTFSDIRQYLVLLANGGALEEARHQIVALMEWAKTSLFQGATSKQALRCTTASVQIIFCIMAQLSSNNYNQEMYNELEAKYMPTLNELVNVWKDSLSLGGTVKAEDGGQKEIQPGDELAILIVQYLLHRDARSAEDGDSNSLWMAACLLEKALAHSPYNPHLKLVSLHIYSRLGAASKSLELYKELGVKQIQLDSCPFVILDILRKGGLYSDVIEICSSIVKLHYATAKDVGDFCTRAMDNGNLSKAEEFIQFQRSNMRESLTLLWGKGLIMDCAPLVYNYNNDYGSALSMTKIEPHAKVLGAMHGLCGCDEDMDRATNMINEVNTHCGAPNIVSIAATATDKDKTRVSDNRDFSMLSYEILHEQSQPTADAIIHESMRRGMVHGLLLRAVLCVDAARGPKKGKPSNPSDGLIKICKSMLVHIDRCQEFSSTDSRGDIAHGPLLQAMIKLCRVLVVVSCGLPKDDGAVDTFALRESQSVELLQDVSTIITETQSKVQLRNEATPLSRRVEDVCELLPDYLVSLFGLVEMTGKLFALVSWGKRKQHTKAAPSALAGVAKALGSWAHSIRDILLTSFPSMTSVEEAMAAAAESQDDGLSCEYFSEMFDSRIIQTVIESRQETRNRVLPFLHHMVDTLDSYDTPIQAQ